MICEYCGDEFKPKSNNSKYCPKPKPCKAKAYWQVEKARRKREKERVPESERTWQAQRERNELLRQIGWMG